MTAARGKRAAGDRKRQVRRVSFEDMRGRDQGEKMRKRAAATKTKRRKAAEVID